MLEIKTPCLVVVPMKDPSDSKTRLSTALNPIQRRSLARLLFARTLEVLKHAQRMMGSPTFSIAVVTGSDEASKTAQVAGVQVIPEGNEKSLSGATNTAAHWAEAHGFKSICIFPADLAAPDAKDIVKFVKRGVETARAMVCPSTDMGTNAILVSPPAAISFRYGKGSARYHQKALESAGLAPVIMELDSLKFDVDTSECLEIAVSECDYIKASIASET